MATLEEPYFKVVCMQLWGSEWLSTFFFLEFGDGGVVLKKEWGRWR